MTGDRSPGFAGALMMMALMAAGSELVAQPVASPPTAVAPTARGTRLILLGTGGGPIVRAHRSEPASLLVVDGRAYLFDVGEGTVSQLKKAGFEATDVSQTFITHLHYDHTGGLAALIGFNWVSGQRRPTGVSGPPGTKTLVEGALSYLSIGETLYAAHLPPGPRMSEIVRAQDLQVTGRQKIFEDDRIRVYAVANSHYATLPQAKSRNWQSFSYRVETPDKVIVFTGDTGPSEAVVDLARGADILVTEIVDLDAVMKYMKSINPVSDEALALVLAHMAEEHLVPAEVGRLAQEAGVKMVVLSHIAPGLDEKMNILPYVREIEKIYKGPVISGQDLDQF